MEDCYIHAETSQMTATDRYLTQLEESKRRFVRGEAKRLERLLARLGAINVSDAESLVRLHEALLFFAAYPQTARIKNLVESALKTFVERIDASRTADFDLSSLESPEVSGIAGMGVTDTFTYPIVSWLVRKQQGRVDLDWDWFEDENRLAETWTRFMPLLEEDAFVEANVPYQTWLGAASGGAARDLPWLIRRFESLPKSELEKAELYDSQKLYVRWVPPYRASRTGMRLPGARTFYHREPLIQRRDIDFKREVENAPPELVRLSKKEGEAILDMARQASTIRYRELYGFTHGDAERVYRTNLGRGVDIFIMGVPAGRRLPLRAYHAAMIFKNGVPVGYFEGLSLFERMESGFNLYYTFRDGETAWLYARTLNVFRHMLGVTAFAIDPYQVGHENEEGIESGAFWFYRKLGFRPADASIAKLVAAEEEKIAHRPGYRTSARGLRKLAAGPMIFELEAQSNSKSSGDWDRFQVRKIGLAVQRHMNANFSGDAEKMKIAAMKHLASALGTPQREFDKPGFMDFAVTLSLVRDLPQWSKREKEALEKIIRAKSGPEESSYLKLMQKHPRLREAIIRLGS
jgi:hypothetical protein